MTLFKKFSRNFDWSRNMALVNGGYLHYMEMKKFLKILLLWNPWSDFKIIWQGCSLGDPCSCEWELLALYGHDEILENSLSLKPLVRFKKKNSEMFLGWPFWKLVRKFWSIKKHGSRGWGILALIQKWRILKNSSFWNWWSDFEMNFTGDLLKIALQNYKFGFNTSKKK